MKRLLDNRLLELMSPLGMAKIGGFSLQVYVGGVAKANIGTMNEGKQKTEKFTIRKLHEGPFTGPPHDKHGLVIASYSGEHFSPGKLKKPVPTIKNHSWIMDP